MSKPPDRYTNNIPQLIYDEKKKCNISSNGPAYVVMSRIDCDRDLKSVSPFLIHKAIIRTFGEVVECTLLRSCQILIKTKNDLQAIKLSMLVSLTNTINIEITPHKTLNQSKGVINCNELRGIPEEEILNELKAQKVTEVHKILKKLNDNLTETGLVILTFSNSELPDQINIGYCKCSIRPYIPQPIRCKNCHQYNHTAKFCTKPRMCATCGNLYHLNDILNEKCLSKQNCLNCSHHNLPTNDHATYDRKCPVFIKESEIQAIKTKNKVDYKTAKKIHEDKNPSSFTSYSSIASKATTTTANTTTLISNKLTMMISKIILQRLHLL